MEKGENYITTKLIDAIGYGQKNITIPKNKVITFLENYENCALFDVDGEQVHIFYGPAEENSMRRLPYPLDKPSTIVEYQHLFYQLIGDMEERLGVNHVVVHANKLNVKISIS